MLRRALVASLAIGLAGLSAASLASDIKPKAALSAFTAKMHPDILGISSDSTAESARAIFESAFKDRAGTKTDIQRQKFAGNADYIAALTFDFPAAAKQSGEVLSASFSSPATTNRAYVIIRNLTFAQEQQPSKAEMIKQAMDKYGVPTLVGDQHLYYIYRAGKIVSVGAKLKAATALDAIDRPLDPKAAIKLNGSDGKGSCVAVMKRLQARERTLSAMLDEAKAANCDGALSVQLTPGIAPDRVGNAQFTLLDLKRIVSAAAIDGDALAAENNARNPAPQGNVPKL
jgi:hypothetical protein